MKTRVPGNRIVRIQVLKDWGDGFFFVKLYYSNGATVYTSWG